MKLTNKQAIVLNLASQAAVNDSVSSDDVCNLISPVNHVGSSLLGGTLNSDTPGVVLDEKQPYVLIRHN